MSAKLLTEHHLEFLRIKRGCTSSSKSTLVKVTHCRKSHVTAHLLLTVTRMSYRNLTGFTIEIINVQLLSATGVMLAFSGKI